MTPDEHILVEEDATWLGVWITLAGLLLLGVLLFVVYLGVHG